MNAPSRSALLCAAGALGLFALTGCPRNMDVQPKFLPDQQNYYFPQVPPDRLPVAHTIPTGPLNDDPAFNTGMVNGVLVADFPLPITPGLVARGREEFDINCSACHGRDGYGAGIVVQRGFPAPPAYHIDRLRSAPAGHFFDVITNGYGVMYPFGSRIPPADRWAIVAYIRALQFSQDAPAGQLPAPDQAQLESAK
jgi:mono/diheme cytochrome c family protein